MKQNIYLGSGKEKSWTPDGWIEIGEGEKIAQNASEEKEKVDGQQISEKEEEEWSKLKTKKTIVQTQKWSLLILLLLLFSSIVN